MPGVMSWEEMNWEFPDFADTCLIYHSKATDNLASIFTTGLVPSEAKDQHEIIYEAQVR